MSRKKKTMDDAIAKGISKFEADNAKSIELEIGSARSSKEASAINIKDVSPTEHSRLATLKDKQVRRLKGQEDKREREKQDERQSFAMSRVEALIRTYKVEKIIQKAASKGEKSCKVGMPFGFEIDAEQNHLVSGDAWTWDDGLVTPSGHEISAGSFRNLFMKVMEDRGIESDLKTTFLKITSIRKINDSSVQHSNYHDLRESAERWGVLEGKCTTHGGWILGGNVLFMRCSKRRNLRFWTCSVGSHDSRTIHCLNIKWK